MVDTLVNTYTTNAQLQPTMAMAADGSFVVTWQSTGQDGSALGIYGQRYAADGTPIDGEFRVNTTTAGDQQDPSVAMAADGSFVVTWGSGTDIYGQRYAADGTPDGTEFLVNTTTSGDQARSAIAMAADGGFVVTWLDGTAGDIYGQRYAADGTPAGTEFLVSSSAYTLNVQTNPAIAMAVDGSFVVTWTDSSLFIRAQRYEADGTPAGTTFQVASNNPARRNAAVTMAEDGSSFVVTYQTVSLDGSGEGVYGRRYGADGTPLGGEFRVNTFTAGDQVNPVTAMAADGSFVVIWQSAANHDGVGWGIYGQRFAANGVKLGTEFLVNTVTGGDQVNPTIAMAANGSFTVSWQSGDGNDNGIHMRQFDAGGAPMPDIDLNGAAAGSSHDPAVISGPALGLPANIATADATLLGAATQRMASLTAQLGGQLSAGDALGLDATATDAANQAGLIVNFDAASGTLTVSGDAALSVYETILRGILYINADETSGLRTVTVTTTGSGGAGAPAVTTLDVNGHPVALADSYAANEDAPLTVMDMASGVLGNDIDHDGLLAVLVSGVSHGTLSLSALGTFIYTPAANFNGTDSFTYKATDGISDSVPVTVTITVAAANDAPAVANPIADQAATEDQAFSFTLPGNVFADIDAGDSLSYTASLANGDPLPAWLSFDPATGTFTGTPANADVGPISIRVTATDSGGASISDDFTLTVANVDDPPVLASPIGSQAATEDQPFSLSIAANIVDVDDALVFTVEQVGGDPLPAWLHFDAATRTFSGTPANGDVGTLEISVSASDGHGGVIDDSFTLTIGNTNDAPTVANAIADQAATEDQAFTFTVPANAFADIDAGDSLTYTATLASGDPLPAWLSFDAATRSFSGTPTNDNVATLTIRVTATDGSTATASDDFTLTVGNTNDAPVVANTIADQAATEDQAFTFALPANIFADVDAGDSLTCTATLANGDPLPAWLSFDGTTFTGTPTNANVGEITIRVSASDGHGGIIDDSFTLTIGNTNDAPLVANTIADQAATEDQGFTFTLPANVFADVDADDSLTCTATLASGDPLPAWLSFDAATRSFTGTPANGDVGSITIRVTATDGSAASVTDDFTLTIGNTNDAPVVANTIADQAATEDQDFTFTLPANVFADVDADDSLTCTAALANGDPLPAWLSFDAATRSFTGTPANGDVGSITIRVTATDGSAASVSDDFTLTIGNTNDAPTVANPIADQTATQDAAFAFTLPADVFADVDAGDSLTLIASLANGDPLPAWLSFDGTTFAGTPSNAEVGAITIRVTATDGSTAFTSDTFTLTVGNTNDAPTVANPIADQAATEDQSFSFTVPANACADIDAGATLTYTAALAGGGALPAWLSFDAASRTFSGTPASADVGAIDITVTASDGTASVDDTFTLTIGNTNDAPTLANPIADQTASQDAAFTFTLPADAFADIDAGTTLTYTATLAGGGALPTWLSFDGTAFTGTPGSGDVGTIDITVTASDGTASIDDTFTITIGNVNDAPAGVADSLTAEEDTPATYAAALLLGNDTDADGDTLTITSVGNASGGSVALNLDGSVTFTADPDFHGTASFTYTATDGHGGTTGPTTVTVAVAPVNDTPTAAAEVYATTAGATLAIDAAAGLLFNDTDVDGDSLAASLTDGPDHGSLTLNPDGSFTYTPEAGFGGADHFTYSVSDGQGGSHSAEVALTVTPVTTAGPEPTLDILAVPLDLQVSALYVAFFGRGADGAGLDYWMNDVTHYDETTEQSFADLYTDVADNFGRSAEAQATYAIFSNPAPSTQDIHDFLGAVYDNLFNRAPDAAGLAYWTAEIEQVLGRGGFVGDVLVTIIGGAQNSADGQDITTLTNKALVGQAYAEMLQEQGIGWDPGSDLGDATALIESVGDDPLSVLTALQQIDQIAQDHHII